MRKLLALPLFILGCLFPTSETDTGRVLPPGNLSALWVSDFKLGLFWDPPQHSATNCSYIASAKINKSTLNRHAPPWHIEVMDGRLVRCSVVTVCNGTRSEPALLNFSSPELLRNLKCFLYAPHRASCQWSPGEHLQDVRFFYELRDECFGATEAPVPSTLRECPSYTYTDGVRTGCDLAGTKCDVVDVLVNGTLEDRRVRNTFRRMLKDNVRPPPLAWTVTKSWNKFNISWTPPAITLADQWSIEIKSIECGETENSISIKEETFFILERTPHCQYRLAIRATNPKGETPWSDWKQFDADPNVLVYLAFIVPVAVAVLAALVCVGFQRNKEKIFPKVPEPRDFLSDFYDVNKSTMYNMYVPAKEEESCKITLVVDPQPAHSG